MGQQHRQPRHPERHPLLHATVTESLTSSLADRSRELAAAAVGSDSRYGPKRMVANLLALHAGLLGGYRIRSVADIVRLLESVRGERVSRKEAAAVLALVSGPSQLRLNPFTGALVQGSMRQAYELAPAEPQALLISGPNSPAPGVHRRGKRVAQKGPTFGIGIDGHQRFAVAYATAAYGEGARRGYSAALAGFTRPSVLDDEDSARGAGRELAVESPVAYLCRLAEQVLLEVDEADPRARELAVALMDGRRDCGGEGGITIESKLDTLAEDPEWARVAELPGERVKMLEVSDANRDGGGGLSQRLIYQPADTGRRPMTADEVEDAIERRDPEGWRELERDMEVLPPLEEEAAGEQSGMVMVMKGTLMDTRNENRARLLMFASKNPAAAYMAIPFGPYGDPFPHLHKKGRHPEAERAITLTMRAHDVGPSEDIGQCRRKVYEYPDYCYVPAKDADVRENIMGLGVHVRMSDIDYPSDHPGGELLEAA